MSSKKSIRKYKKDLLRFYRDVFKDCVLRRGKTSKSDTMMVYLVTPDKEVFDILSADMARLDVNKSIRKFVNYILANCPNLGDEVATTTIIKNTPYVANKSYYEGGEVVLSTDGLTLCKESDNFLRLLVLHMALPQENDNGELDLAGTNLNIIVERVSNLLKGEVLDRKQIVSHLIENMKRYNFLVLNKWTKCFWYKDSLRQVVRNQNLLYLPTIEIK